MNSVRGYSLFGWFMCIVNMAHIVVHILHHMLMRNGEKVLLPCKVERSIHHWSRYFLSTHVLHFTTYKP